MSCACRLLTRHAVDLEQDAEHEGVEHEHACDHAERDDRFTPVLLHLRDACARAGHAHEDPRGAHAGDRPTDVPLQMPLTTKP